MSMVAGGGAQSFTNDSDLNATTAAINGMMSFYNTTDGRWNTEAPWWQSGIAVQTLVDFMQLTGSEEYLPQIYHTINIQSAPLPWWPEGGGNFRADSTDDTGWWALAMTSMFELTGNVTYLKIATEDEAYMYSYWSSTPCSGGIVWDIPSRTYYNAISNELYLELTATLHNLLQGDTLYLNRSLQEWEWFKNSGMINSASLVNDGLMDGGNNNTCVNNDGTTWTYNQGVILGGLVQLYKATGDFTYLDTAKAIADAVIASAELAPGGILTEPCGSVEECEINGFAFKGIFMQRLQKLDAVLPDRPYSGFILQNARSAYGMDRAATSGLAFYGRLWQGPYDEASIARQESVVQLFVAALKSGVGLEDLFPH
ncbi:putative glycosyl hydrolase [Pseudomassariella vexata]|uniref:Putative glycosyl hydrolase n=1 Tax=Pseudomassariella vexata TaxID=1141098 RepID=A0A1Y2DGY4_9PEZI|nr:putative glycosyl hydrolase [Pseudomassariella vexata]ORY58497.1 putative glycosyl hydrolase [Pseudomassariella vexata]